MKSIALLVSTCDSYSFLWDNFKTLISKNIPIEKKYSCSETLSIGENYIPFNTNTAAWSDRLINALKRIEEEYIFFVLEDYYMTKKILSAEIDSILDTMIDKNLDKFLLQNGGNMPHTYKTYEMIGVDGVEKQISSCDYYGSFMLVNQSPYLTSLQPAVWKREALLGCLEKNWTPWDFEIKGTHKASTMNINILMYYLDEVYFNACRKGKTLSPGWDEVKRAHNLKELKLL